MKAGTPERLAMREARRVFNASAGDALETEVMAADSLTDSVLDTDSAPSAADDPGVTIATATVNTGSVQGIVMLMALVIFDLDNSEIENASGLNLRIERDATSIFDWDGHRQAAVNIAGFPLSIFHVDTGYDLSSAVVYDLIGDLYTGETQAITLHDLIFIAVEMRR